MSIAYPDNPLPVELFIDREDMRIIHARSGFTIGSGCSVEDALGSLKERLGPDALRVRLEKMKKPQDSEG